MSTTETLNNIVDALATILSAEDKNIVIEYDIVRKIFLHHQNELQLYTNLTKLREKYHFLLNKKYIENPTYVDQFLIPVSSLRIQLLHTK